MTCRLRSCCSSHRRCRRHNCDPAAGPDPAHRRRSHRAPSRSQRHTPSSFSAGDTRPASVGAAHVPRAPDVPDEPDRTSASRTSRAHPTSPTALDAHRVLPARAAADAVQRGHLAGHYRAPPPMHLPPRCAPSSATRCRCRNAQLHAPPCRVSMPRATALTAHRSLHVRC